MKLSQALKQKNRLAGEMARLQSILNRENARRSDSVSTVDRLEVYTKILKTSEELGALKARIAKANVGIYEKLERMSELKAFIAFLVSLPKRQGEEVSFVGRDQEKLTYTWNSFVNVEQCDDTVSKLQEQIACLQDSVDEFNATTEI